MSLRPGTFLGTYELLAEIGRGGMGEVYRARDPKLDRLVAIKVLPAQLAENPDFLARFQREAKAIAALNHPNLVGIYDLGQDGPHRFAVMELLEGETLGACLARGPLPLRKAVELAIQMAQGMAAAHEKGIIHRDLKPDNLWITREGRLKILDFGLAKQTRSRGQDTDTEALSLGPLTQHGVILGTAGYMSPEQVKGEPVDHRSDLFSFGVVLYEMLTGRRAFRGETPIQTMNAILEAEPEELRIARGHLPPALEHLVLHCLEKRPENRFQSMRDLAYTLEHMSGSSERMAPFLAPFAPRNRRASQLWAVLGAALVLGATLAAWRLGHAARPALGFEPLTFVTAPIWEARFTRDGGSVVFTRGGFDPAATSILTLSLDNPLPREVLGRNNALAALSRTNELASLSALTSAQGRPETFSGTLGRGPLGGASPRAVSGRVVAADWAPDGAGLALVRDLGLAGMQIEYPEGKVLARLDRGWFSHLRFSPDGRSLAVLRHPVFGDDMGTVAVLDLGSGSLRELTPNWSQVRGLAWRNDGREIWFTGTESINRELLAVDLHGHLRSVLSAPSDLNLFDIAPDGRVLVSSGAMTLRIFTWELGATDMVDLTIKSYSQVRSISPDGRQLVIDDESVAGPEYPMYLCGGDGGMPTPLGLALNACLMPGQGKVFILRGNPAAPKGVMLTLATGQEEPYPMGALYNTQAGVICTPKGELLALQANGTDPGRIWRLSPKAPPAQVGPPLPPGVNSLACAGPEGRRLVLQWPDRAVAWLDLGEPGTPIHPLLPPAPRTQAVACSPDGAWLYVTNNLDPPVLLDRVNLVTGKREPFRKLDLPLQQGSGFRGILSEDGKRWIGQTRRLSAQLFLVEGLR